MDCLHIPQGQHLIALIPVSIADGYILSPIKLVVSDLLPIEQLHFLPISSLILFFLASTLDPTSSAQTKEVPSGRQGTGIQLDSVTSSPPDIVHKIWYCMLRMD